MNYLNTRPIFTLEVYILYEKVCGLKTLGAGGHEL